VRIYRICGLEHTTRGGTPALGYYVGPLSPQHGASSDFEWKRRPPYVAEGGGVGANIQNKPSRTTDKGWYSSLGVGRGTNNLSP